MNESKNGSSEPLVVRSNDLGSLLDRFGEEWLSARNPRFEHTTYDRGDKTPQHGIEDGRWRTGTTRRVEGPWNWLAQESGVSVRKIYAIRKRQMEYVVLSRADALVQAMGVPQAWWDGRLPLITNPHLNESTWRQKLVERGCLPPSSVESVL